MPGEHYATFIEQAFLDPIRSVLIVDDDYPTYEEVLGLGNQGQATGHRRHGKSWHRDPVPIARVVQSFRRGPRPLLVDIHDGSNVSGDAEMGTAGHLHQCDLLVLDYELDKGRRNDGSRAIEILRKLMTSAHFNLVIIYTNAELEGVFDAVRWALIVPWEDDLTEGKSATARDLIQVGEDSFEGFEGRLWDSVQDAQYFHSRGSKKYLRTMAKRQEPYSEFCRRSDEAEWSRDDREIVLRYLLREREIKNGVNDASGRRFRDLEWSLNEPLWIKSGSAFIALSNKNQHNGDVLHQLRRALIDWGPPPSQLVLTKLRAEIDEYGIAVQGRALGNRHASAYWYHGLLNQNAIDARRWRIAEVVSRHSDQLLSFILPGVVDFASCLVDAEVAAGAPEEICKLHFGVDLDNVSDKTKAALEHNAFVCSMEPSGSHLTTGHVFTISNEQWLCLSPACDLVPSQIPAWSTDAFGERLPFVGVKLHEIRMNTVPKDIHSNRFIFLRIDGQVKGYCFNEPSGESSVPRWHILFADNRGQFNAGSFQFTLDYVVAEKTRLAARRCKAEVIAQLRYEYAINLTQRLGLSLMRVGLDFAGRHDLEG